MPFRINLSTSPKLNKRKPQISDDDREFFEYANRRINERKLEIQSEEQQRIQDEIKSKQDEILYRQEHPIRTALSDVVNTGRGVFGAVKQSFQQNGVLGTLQQAPSALANMMTSNTSDWLYHLGVGERPEHTNEALLQVQNQNNNELVQLIRAKKGITDQNQLNQVNRRIKQLLIQNQNIVNEVANKEVTNMTNKQMIGEALGVAGELGTVIPIGGAAKAAGLGAKVAIGGLEGAGIGGLFGIGGELKENKEATRSDIIRSGLTGAIVGGALGAATGGVMEGASKITRTLSENKVSKALIEAENRLGELTETQKAILRDKVKKGGTVDDFVKIQNELKNKKTLNSLTQALVSKNNPTIVGEVAELTKGAGKSYKNDLTSAIRQVLTDEEAKSKAPNLAKRVEKLAIKLDQLPEKPVKTVTTGKAGKIEPKEISKKIEAENKPKVKQELLKTPENKANYEVVAKAPEKPKNTIRIYHTTGGDEKTIGAGAFVDTKLDEHIQRGMANETKIVSDIPVSEAKKYLVKPAAKDKLAIGIYKVKAEIPDKFNTFIKPKAEPKITYESTIGVSKLAKGIKSKAVRSKLIAGFDRRFKELPDYDKMIVKEQAKKATELVLNDPERAIRIAMGDERPKGNLKPESVLVAVEEHAIQNKDVELLRRLATESKLVGESTEMGQRLRMLAERNPYSAPDNIREVVKARQKKAEERFGAKLNEKKKEILGSLKEKVRKGLPDKKDWMTFLEEIKCKA